MKDKEALDHLFEAEKHLNQAGISFDTGVGPVGRDGGERAWELDWSLKGAKLRQQAAGPFCQKEKVAAWFAGKLESVEMEQLPPPFRYVGGKRKMVPQLLALIPPHKTYVEPFVGGGALFWAKAPSEIEVLSDVDPDVARFYRNLAQVQYCPLHQLADPQKLSAKTGQQSPCEFLADVTCSFGAHRFLRDKARAGILGSTCRNDHPTFHRYLPAFQQRLQGVQVYHADWERIASQYDSPDTFFYLDPPYVGTSTHYNHPEDVMGRLAQVLPTLTGKWLLSYDDNPKVQAAFRGFQIKHTRSPYTTGGGDNYQQGHQLLITNYSLSPGQQMNQSILSQKARPICTPAQAARLERCIKEVKAKGTARNPWAVCTASIGCRFPASRRGLPMINQRAPCQTPGLSGAAAALLGCRRGTRMSANWWEHYGSPMRRFVMYQRNIPKDTHDKNQANASHEPQFEGVVFSDGKTAIRWLTAKRSVAVWDNFEDMMAIHGHPEHDSELKWLDANEKSGQGRMSTSLLEFLINGAAQAAGATAAATLVSRVMGGGIAVTSPEAVIRVIDDRKDRKTTPASSVHNPKTVEGDQAEVDLGTLLAEIDVILKTPGKLGEVDPQTLRVVREGG